MDEFWLVWNPESGYAKYRHDSEGTAVTEAKRLSEQNIGTEFHVLKSVGHALVKQPVEWVKHTEAELPF